MTVWIINPYGTLPTEPWATYRSTMIAEALSRSGYTVTQFISNFEHRSKTFRSPGYETRTLSENYSVSIIPSTPYYGHISWQRIRYEREFAKNLLRHASGMASPDFFILAEPALFYYNILLSPLFKNGKSKLVVDIIDIWPELFELALPRWSRWMSNLILSPLFFWRNRLYKHAHAVVAVAKDYLEIARSVARGVPASAFEVVYWSYYPKALPPSGQPDARIKKLAEEKAKDEVWIVYAGTLGENYDIPSIVRAASALHQDLAGKANFKFIVAGDGPLKKLCEDHVSDTFVFLGRLHPEQLNALYQCGDIALSTYKGESTVAMPIKAFDYIEFGLPIVNSLGRDLGALVSDNEIGRNYDPNNPEALFNVLKELIFDSGLRATMAANARKLAPDFRADAQYHKFVRLLKSLK